MLSLKLLAGAVAGAGVLALLLVHGHHPTSSLQERVAKALASRDRAKMESLAAELERQGHTEAAQSLRSEASLLPASAPALKSAGSLMRQVSAELEDPGRKRAQELVEHLQNHPRESEDRELVRAFQVAEKLNGDGRYGPGTATRILARYGIIPPAPYYWSKGPTGRRQKEEFLKFVATSSTGDQERVAQYERLARDAQRS